MAADGETVRGGREIVAEDGEDEDLLEWSEWLEEHGEYLSIVKEFTGRDWNALEMGEELGVLADI